MRYESYDYPAMLRKLIIEPPMSETQARALTTEAEQAEAASFGSARRRREYLGWRAVVRRELGEATTIGYDAAGAPVVDLPGIHISVAHCAERIAVCISDRRCCVDIEPQSRDFSRAAARYLNDAERTLSDDPLLPAAVWCAKEALYKFAGKPGTDFRRDIRIRHIDFAAGTIEGSISGSAPIALSLLRREGFIAVYRL